LKHLYIIGMGTGNPEHMTVQAINALGRADVVFVPSKGDDKLKLAQVRRDICERYGRNGLRIVDYAIPVRETESRSYGASVDHWHADIASIYERLISEEVPDEAIAAFLVWGDPGLYDSTIRIVERVKARNHVSFDYSIIPGITSIQALTASHRVPLNLVGKPVLVTTGRRLADSFPDLAESVVVMLDGEQAFAKIDDPDAFIYWGAYVGTADEILIAGRLADVSGQIVAARAAARAQHGWIMDIYLLRKGRDFED
jgi:precorrin-6A synthase